MQQVRTEEAEPEAPEQKAVETPDLPRKREVITPNEPASPLPIADRTEDPFIAEARERAAADPEAAMAWLQVQSMSEDRLRGMLEVVAVWATKDSEGALLWLESNAQGLARHATIESGMALWAQQDPNTGSHLDRRHGQRRQQGHRNARTRQQLGSDHPGAQQWVEQLPHGTIRKTAAAEFVQSAGAR